MRCFSCDKDATRECRRCGRLYCDEHGDELCERCLKPAGALPSFLLYRGTLLALLLGTVVALYLLLKPPQEASQSTFNIVQPTATTAIVRTPTGGPTPTPNASPNPSPNASPNASPAATPTAGGVIAYTVQPGDTLVDIATRYLPTGMGINDFMWQIATHNGLDPSNPILQPGQILNLPQ
ncbi:MAG: LysM peptidoglycan-binding domain-containing protein [Dehalococcoidia bacterium]|jgi:hypothetical protein